LLYILNNTTIFALYFTFKFFKMIKQIMKRQTLPVVYTVNTETGELIELDSNIAIVNDRTRHGIEYEEFYIVNADANDWSYKKLTAGERDKFGKLLGMIRGELNKLCKRDGSLHTLDSLTEALELTKPKVYSLMKRFIHLNLIAYLYITKDGKSERVIVLNPFYARKAKVFNVSCSELFLQRFKS